MTSEFANLEAGQYEPTDAVWWTVPIKGEPELLVVHAGKDNRGYAEAVAKANAKSGTARRAARGMASTKTLDDSLELDRKLFPRHVIRDWRGVRKTSDPKKDVPFSPTDCEAFLRLLPDWIVQELSSFCAVAAHFLPDDAPDEDEVDESAGK